jgi:hypothetical protein
VVSEVAGKLVVSCIPQKSLEYHLRAIPFRRTQSPVIKFGGCLVESRGSWMLVRSSVFYCASHLTSSGYLHSLLLCRSSANVYNRAMCSFLYVRTTLMVIANIRRVLHSIPTLHVSSSPPMNSMSPTLPPRLQVMELCVFLGWTCAFQGGTHSHQTAKRMHHGCYHHPPFSNAHLYQTSIF